MTHLSEYNLVYRVCEADVNEGCSPATRELTGIESPEWTLERLLLINAITNRPWHLDLFTIWTF